MELIERPNMKAVHFLNSITFEKFRQDCIDDAVKTGDKKPKETDMKTWYNLQKQFCKTNIKTKGITKRIYSYSQTTPAGLGGRLFGGGSIQGIWSVYRGLLMKGIGTDIDMSNCHPVILLYICKKHGLKCTELEYYINNRDKCLSEFSSRSVGKTAYLKATNDDKFSRDKTLPKSFKDYDKEMKQLQKQLVVLPEYQELRETIPEYKLTKNYNGSALNRILCYYENIILQHCIHVLNTKSIEVAILMFDGLMVYGDHYNNPELLNEIEKHVEEQMTGLNMKWTYKEHDTTLQIPEDFDEKEYENEFRYVCDDNSASILIFDELKDVIIPAKGRMFLKRKNVWLCDDNVINDYVLDYILKSNICKQNDDKKYIPYNQNVKSAKNVREALLVKIRNQEDIIDIYEKFHTTTRNRLCFKDGVLDFKARRFYNWDEINFEYYSTVMIQREYGEYFKNPDTDKIEFIKDKVFVNLFGDNTNKALHFLSRGISGNYQDKNWATYLGNRDCGKGVLYECLSSAFLEYVKTFELGNIMYERHTDTQETSRKLYWLMDFEFVRLGISQETPPSSSKLQASGKLIKKLAGGGDTHVARRNYDRFDTHFKIDTTLFFMGNDELQVDCKDTFEHCIQFQSVNQFKTQAEIDKMRGDGESELLISSFKVKDPTIKERCQTEEWANAVVYLLFENYMDNAVSIDITNNNDDEEIKSLRKQILDMYEITGCNRDEIICDDVYNCVGESKKKIWGELQSMGIVKRKSNKGPTRDKLCFYGLKSLYDPENEIPENNM